MFRLATLLAAASALAFASTAGAKLTAVTVTPPAAAPRADMPWMLTVHVWFRGKPYAKPDYRPELYVVDRAGTPRRTFRGTRVRTGTFRIEVRFPKPGKWRYVIPDPLNGEWWFTAPRVVA